ncbi:MAG: hypothetical protein AB1480_03765 [Nitrospirota bacterium]
MNGKTLQIRGRLTSATFEKKFLEDLKFFWKQLNSEATLPIEFSIDLSELLWIDLLESMCLSITADWIMRNLPNSTPVFTIYTPNILLKEDHFQKLLKFPIENAKKTLDERIKTKSKHSTMRENVFHWCLWKWKLLHFIRSKQLSLYVLLENQRYLWNDILFTEETVSKPRIDPEKVLEITSILERKDLPTIRGRIETALKKDLPNLPSEEIINFSHLVHRLCENICDHAYEVSDSLPKTGAVAIRYIGKSNKKTGLANMVDHKIKKYKIFLKDAQRKAFQDLQIPERFHSFYEKYYDSPIFEIVVVDGGKGVYTTLNGAFKSHARREGKPFEVLQYAFEEGSTSKKINRTHEKEIGLGLFKVKEQTLRWDGIIEMRSCQSRITFSKDYKDGLPPDPNDQSKEITYFPGTQLRVLIPAQNLGQLILF